MYKKIYQILEETGKVKTAMFLNGSHSKTSLLLSFPTLFLVRQKISGKNMRQSWLRVRIQKSFISKRMIFL